MPGALEKVNAWFFMAAAQRLASEGSHEKALEAFRDGLAHTPDDAGLHLHMGLCLLAMGRRDDAVAVLRKAAEREPENAACRVFLAMGLLDCCDTPGAREAYERLVALQPDNQAAYAVKILIDFHEGRAAEALEALARSGLPGNSELASRLVMALEAAMAGALAPPRPCDAAPAPAADAAPAPAADAAPEPVADATPAPAPAADAAKGDGAHRRGLAALEGKRILHDLVAYGKARYAMERGLAYLEREKPEPALPFFDRALELMPSLFRIHYLAGEAYFYSGRYDKAFELFTASQATDGDNFGLFYYLGRIHQERGELERARKYFDDALKLFEKLPEARYALGQIALRAGDRDEALRCFREYVRSDTLTFESRLKEAREKFPPETPPAEESSKNN